MLGIDLVVPDATYLAERRDAVRGIILTHGHEDHTGGLPYVLPRISGTPIYASKLTIGLVTGKLKEHKLLGATTLHVVEPGVEFAVGAFRITSFRVNHSIRAGSASHPPGRARSSTPATSSSTTPPDGDAPTSGSSPWGKRGRGLPLSDSTRAERRGLHPVGGHGRGVAPPAHRRGAGRVIMATFASNIGRVQQAIDAAAEHGRKVVLIGRSMSRTRPSPPSWATSTGATGPWKKRPARATGPRADGRDHRLPG